MSPGGCGGRLLLVSRTTGKFKVRCWSDNHRHRIEEATEEKCKLEQKQREDAKERKETGVKWENRLFHPIGEGWQFNKPLGSATNSTPS